MTPTVYLNVRDRVSELRQLVAWLERAGAERIVLLDNASTYGPLLEYLKASPHEVVWLGENCGSQALWAADMVPDTPFVYSDPDVIPIDDCPFDAIAHLSELLERYPQLDKAGLGFYLDDVSESMPSLGWERHLMRDEAQIAPGVYDSPVDSTFAVYRAGAAFTHNSVRTGSPYLARHTSWYETTPSAEAAYYLERAIAGPTGSSWKEWV